MSAYNLPVAYRLKEQLDRELFLKACNFTFNQHPILNTRIIERMGVPFQEIERQREIDFKEWQIADLNEDEILSFIKEKAREPFCLENGPLVRFHLFLAPDREQIILIVIHHIIIDGVSLLLFLKTLWKAYADYKNFRSPILSPSKTSYRDFVLWEKMMVESSAGQKHLEYWKKTLSGDLPILSMPVDFPSGALPDLKGESYQFFLSSELTREVMHFSRSRRINPSILFLGLFKVFIYRYTSQTDIVVGMPTMGRPEPRFEAVIGYFINMVAFRSPIDGDTLFTDLITTLRSTVFEGLSHAVFPFPALVRELKLPRDTDLSPIFQVTYTYQNYLKISGNQTSEKSHSSDEKSIEVSMEELRGLHQEGENDFGLEVIEHENLFEINMEYNPGRFRLTTIEQMMRHYINLLKSVLIEPERAVAKLPMLDPSETMDLIAAGKSTCRYIETLPIHELIRQQSLKTPLSTAVEFGGSAAACMKLTYNELQSGADEILAHLIHRGVTTGEIVALCLGRSIKVVPALLAILKAGAVYMPIDPDFPEKRISHILKDTKACLILVHDTTEDKIRRVIDNPVYMNASSGSCNHDDSNSSLQQAPTPDSAVPVSEDSRVRYLNLDRLETLSFSMEKSDKSAKPSIVSDAPAYIIYTSGSTGVPKGVVVSHRAIANHCAAVRDCYEITPDDTILQFSSFGVDTSLEQILPGLTAGARIWIKDDKLWSPGEFSRKVMENHITVIDIPPGYLHELLLYWSVSPQSVPHRELRLTIVGGEELMPETVRLWLQSPMKEKRLINAYGPTETTITSTVFEVNENSCIVSGSGRTPIGCALGNRDAYILDRDLNLVPPGVVGELYIGGEISSGYLNLPDQTEERFIAYPFGEISASEGSLLYRTGDLARVVTGTDGLIEFLGRMDHQISIRGFRIEPGEIEVKLDSHHMVNSSVVLVRDERLIAYVEGDRGSLSSDELKAFLAERVPSYMVPGIYVIMDKFPLLPGGKVDRLALQEYFEPDRTEHKNFIAPRDEVELALSRIWCKILGISRVGVCDDFFDLGGHSILLVRLTAEISLAFKKELSIATVISNPTVERQALLIRSEDTEISKQVQNSVAVLMQPLGTLPPFFCIHPSGGNILCYIQLARLLGEERPFYGIQSPGISGKKIPESVEAMAGIYIDEIRIIQPHGPYYIGGWSFGGVVAYEVAQQLKRAGEKIACLAMVESFTPDAVRDLEMVYLKQNQLNYLERERLMVSTFIQDLKGSFDRKTVDRLEQELSESPVDKIKEEKTLFSSIIGNIRKKEEISNDDCQLLNQLFTIFKNNIQAMDRYNPDPLDLPVTLIQAQRSGENNIRQESANGWKRVAGKNLQIKVIHGDHYSILTPPDLLTLTEVLKELFAKP